MDICIHWGREYVRDGCLTFGRDNQGNQTKLVFQLARLGRRHQDQSQYLDKRCTPVEDVLSTGQCLPQFALRIPRARPVGSLGHGPNMCRVGGHFGISNLQMAQVNAQNLP
jgi:hypothetical protein